MILAGVFFFLPESKGANKSHSLQLSSIARSYKTVLKEGYFVIYAFVGAIGFSGLFIYIASSPGIFMGSYGLSQQLYGFLFAFIASGLIVASQINNLLLKRYSIEQIITSVLIVQVLFGVLLLLLTIFKLIDFWLLAGLLFCFLAPAGFIMPNGSALAMRPFSENVGSAAALLGFIQMGYRLTGYYLDWHARNKDGASASSRPYGLQSDRLAHVV